MLYSPAMQTSETRFASIASYVAIGSLALFLSWILVVTGQVLYLVLWAIALAAGVTIRVAPQPAGFDVAARVRRFTGAVAHVIDRIPLAHIFWAAIVLRLGVSVLWNVEPRSDFQKFFDQAVAIASGDLSVLAVSKSPLTVLWYGGLFRIFGTSAVVVHTTNAFLGGAQVLLAYRIAREAFKSPTSGRAAAIIVAIMPSLVLFTALPSSEMPFATVLLGTLLVCVNFCVRGKPPTVTIVLEGVILGVLLGLLHLARNVGLLLLVVDVVVILVFARTVLKRRLLFAGACAASLLILLTPMMISNYDRYGVFSPNSHMRWYMNLLSGTNIQSGGQHSSIDWDYVSRTYTFDPRAYPDAVRYAKSTALARITEDPGAFMRFAFTTKFDIMWGSDDYTIGWLTSPSGDPATTFRLGREGRRTNDAGQDEGRRSAFAWVAHPAFSNHAYFVLILLALFTLLGGRGRIRAHEVLVVLIAGTSLLFVALHLLIEVQPRYHHFLPFLLAILVASAFASGTPPESDRSPAPASSRS